MVGSLFIALGLLVVGDSISAHPQGWANILRNDDPTIKVMAHPGRTIRDFDPPRDIKAYSGQDTVIYYLGVNDAFSLYSLGPTVLQFRAHMHFFISRGFRTIVLIPPDNSWLIPEIVPLREMIHRYCAAMDRVECYEIAVWDNAKTIDGIHPNLELHQMIADWVREEVY